MEWNREEIRSRLRHRIGEIAGELGRDPQHLRDDELIPQSGLLDSAGMLSLIVWCEEEFGVELLSDEINLDNFGSVARMLDYLDGARSR